MKGSLGCSTDDEPRRGGGEIIGQTSNREDGHMGIDSPGAAPRAEEPPLRVAEVLAALSLTTDPAAGMTFEKGLRMCAVATSFAGALPDSDPVLCRTVFETALLRSVGCTSYAPELAALFGDDVAVQTALKTLDPGDETVLARQLAGFGEWAGADAPRLAQTLVDAFPTVGVEAMRSGCETSRALGSGLGLRPESLEALDHVYERWDGRGIPDGIVGQRISLAARIVHLAEHRRTRPAGRPVAHPIQVSGPARPGVVRPPAVTAVPSELAGLHAERQTRPVTAMWDCRRLPCLAEQATVETGLRDTRLSPMSGRGRGFRSTAPPPNHAGSSPSAIDWRSARKAAPLAFSGSTLGRLR